jgi:SAM-dependent methyltransferase
MLGLLNVPARQQHRFAPRLWHHDWHHLVNLRDDLQVVLRKHELPRPGDRVLDLGCGDRPYESWFRRPGCEYFGCDLGEGADVRIEPGRSLPLADGSADGVVSFQVLEHVWDLDWYLGECYRLLKPGGWLLLSTHGTWLYHPHPTDFRRWTRDGLERELTSRGFTLETLRGSVGPLAWTTQFRLLGLRHLLLKVPVLGRLLLGPLACLMNLRMVLEDALTPTSIRDVNASVYVTLSRKPARGGGGGNW